MLSGGPAARDITVDGPVEIRDELKKWTVRATARLTGKSPFGGVELDGAVATADPLPPVGADGSLTLPNMGGHAHQRSWERGDIVRVHGQVYKVTYAKLFSPTARVKRPGSNMHYQLEPADPVLWETRPGRMVLDSFDVAEQVGRAVSVRDEWLHVQKIERSSFYGAAGRGTSYWGVGRFVPAAKAAKLNATWDKKARVRSLELSLRVAQTSDMSTPEHYTSLVAELAKAKKAAGIK